MAATHERSHVRSASVWVAVAARLPPSVRKWRCTFMWTPLFSGGAGGRRIRHDDVLRAGRPNTETKGQGRADHPRAEFTFFSNRLRGKKVIVFRLSAFFGIFPKMAEGRQVYEIAANLVLL